MTLGRILGRLMQPGYVRDALRRSRPDRDGRGPGEAGSLFGCLGRDFRADAEAAGAAGFAGGLASGTGAVLAGVAARALIRVVRSSSSEDAGEFSPISTEELEMKAGDLLQEAGMAQAPVPVDEVARYLGIQVDEADLGEECSGMLVRDEESAVIGVNVKRQLFGTETTRICH